MKKLLFVILSFAISLSLNAQENFKEVVSTDYNRSSISCVFIDGRYNSQPDIAKFYKSFEISDKFDYNNIPTKFITLDKKLMNEHYVQTPTTYLNMNHSDGFVNLGKEVVSYIFNRKDDGSFDDSRIKSRGLYNANDQDIKNAAVVKVNDLAFEWGEKLLNSAYIVVVDIYKATSEVTDNGNTKYKVEMVTHAFKLNCDSETLNNFYQTAWIEKGMSTADRNIALKNYDEMVFELSYITSVTSYGSSTQSKLLSGSFYKACNSAFQIAFSELEEKIPAWQTATYITSRNPLEAKIGKKEGVKNGDRFDIYSFRENKAGKIESVKKGMVRATKVADNRTSSDGNSKTTCFYQISGLNNAKEGYILKQKDDLQWGVAIAGGIASDNIRIGLDSDLILHIGKRGAITYAMLSAGIRLNEAKVADAMIGLGYGIPLTRFIEITPSLLGGFYTPIKKDKAHGFEDTSGFAIEPGIRFGITIQPLTIYLNAGYQSLIANDFTDKRSLLLTKAGVKWTF